ncbi:MAG: cellulase family glycosylhydrolase [Gaiellales bacterium]
MGRRSWLSGLGIATFIVAATTVSVPLSGAGPVHPWVTTSGIRFMDTRSGQPVILRGVNVGAGASTSLQNQVVALGANFVRVHVCWSQLEPNAPSGGTHTWNEPLMTSMAQQVAWYQAHNVNVLIDLHQFNWSPYFSGRGCGIPAWFYTQVRGGEYPASGAGLIQAMHTFYRDPEAISLYSDLARMVASRFEGYPAVVGYEVLNEPYGPNNHTGTQNVLSFEAKVRAAIVGVDPNRTVFVMTRYGGDKGLLDADFSAFGSRTHLALDYHDYFAGLPGTGMTFDDEDWSPSWGATHVHTTTDYHGTLAEQQSMLDYPLHKSWDLGIPLLIGEWGVRRDDTNGVEYQSQMLSILGGQGLSWARWSLSANDMFGILAANGRPDGDYQQLQAALNATPAAPSMGPVAPALALSRPVLVRGHAILVCYRAAQAASRVVLGVRTSSGAVVRKRELGSTAGGAVHCTIFKGEKASGVRLPRGDYMLRVKAVYGDGSRYSVWQPVKIA